MQAEGFATPRPLPRFATDYCGMLASYMRKAFPISRPAISQHLKILKDANLVVDRSEGTRRVYQINSAGFESLREYFDKFWSHALEEFKKKVEEQ